MRALPREEEGLGRVLDGRGVLGGDWEVAGGREVGLDE